MEPEQKLYVNVIIQIIEDFIKPNPTAANTSESKIAKQQAVEWFTDASKGLVEVCEYANVDASWLQKRVLTAKYPYTELKDLISKYKELTNEPRLPN